MGGDINPCILRDLEFYLANRQERERDHRSTHDMRLEEYLMRHPEYVGLSQEHPLFRNVTINAQSGERISRVSVVQLQPHVRIVKTCRHDDFRHKRSTALRACEYLYERFRLGSMLPTLVTLCWEWLAEQERYLVSLQQYFYDAVRCRFAPSSRESRILFAHDLNGGGEI